MVSDSSSLAPILDPAILGPGLLCLISVLALVVSDFKGYRPGRYVCKPFAAAAFLWTATALGATDSNYGLWLLAGLTLCAAGDLLLMFERELAFMAGLGAFLVGHVLYAIAFTTLPLGSSGMVLSLAPAVLLAGVTLHWLNPYLGGAMRWAVYAYMLAITAMLVTAGASIGQGIIWPILFGAWGFAISDIAVARRQFVAPAKANGIWGTPLYFASQMLLAVSAGLF